LAPVGTSQTAGSSVPSAYASVALNAPPTLPSRPFAKSFSVQDILVDIRAGRLAVPNFQRPLKWRPQEGALLFDSIIRGYPVGTLLLWRRPRGASKVDVRALLPGHRVDDDALVVIDGQQRLSALARVLLRETPEDLRWDLAWALDEQRVRPLSSRGRDTLIPLAELGDSADLHEWFAGQALRGAEARRVFELGRAVREYTVPAYIIDADDESAVRRIFQRANTSGRRLTADEVFTGLHGGGPGDSIGTLQALGDALADTGFGHVSPKWLHQSTMAVAGLDATTPARMNGAETDDRSFVPARSIAAAEGPLRSAIRFLIEEAAIPHAGLLPYGIVLPVLAAFFRHHEWPSFRNRELLRRWVFRGAVSGLHRGDRIPYRRATIAAARQGPAHDSVQALLELVPRRMAEMPQIPDRFVQSDALVRLFLLGLASMAPRDLVTGDAIDVVELAGNVSKMPRLVSVADGVRAGSGDGVASRLWLPPRRGVLTAKDLTDSSEETLSSHGFGREARGYLMDGDVRNALRLRRESIQVATTTMLLDRCRFGEPDRRPLAPDADALA